MKIQIALSHLVSIVCFLLSANAFPTDFNTDNPTFADEAESSQPNAQTIEMGSLNAGQKDRCPLCLLSFESPGDITMLTKKKKRICRHVYCRKCSSQMVAGYGFVGGEYYRRCLLCKEQLDGFLVVDLTDHDQLFRIFNNPENNEVILLRDFLNGLKVLQIASLISDQEAQEIFERFSKYQGSAANNGDDENGDDINDGEKIVDRDSFPFLWALISQRFAEWFSQPPKITDDQIMRPPVQQNGMTRQTEASAESVVAVSAFRRVIKKVNDNGDSIMQAFAYCYYGSLVLFAAGGATVKFAPKVAVPIFATGGTLCGCAVVTVSVLILFEDSRS